jgi:opacity protein-like surface antigen
MKKLALAISAASLLALSSAQADARGLSWQPYFGVGYQAISLGGVPSASGLPTSLSDGMMAHVGARRGRFAFEIGYSRSDSHTQINTASGSSYATKMAVYGPSLDALMYFPIAGDQLSIIGTLGAGYQTGHGSSTIPAIPFDISKSQISGRAGGGLEWRPYNRFSIDAIARYQTGSIAGLTNGGLGLTIGLNFYL